MSSPRSRPNVTVTYNSTGSGTGKNEFGRRADRLRRHRQPGQGRMTASRPDFYYIPTVAAPITVSYNLQSVDQAPAQPRHPGQIFQRDIKNWNDPAIAEDNPDVDAARPRRSRWPTARTAPAPPTTSPSTWTQGLRRVDARAPATRWTGRPTPRAARRTPAWPSSIKQGDGAIGYVDLARRHRARAALRAIKNKDGNVRAADPGGRDRCRWTAPSRRRPDLRPAGRQRARTPTRSPRRPTSWCGPTTRRRQGGAGQGASSNYLLTDGQELAPAIHFAQAAGLAPGAGTGPARQDPDS